MPKQISASEIGRLGGSVTRDRYGRDHYSRAGKKGAGIQFQKDPNYGKKLSALGVAARLQKAKNKLPLDKTTASPVS